MRRSPDFGRAWSRPAVLSGRRNSRSPAVTGHNDIVVVAWMDLDTDRIFARRSANGGVTWSRRSLVSGARPVMLPFALGYDAVAFYAVWGIGDGAANSAGRGSPPAPVSLRASTSATGAGWSVSEDATDRTERPSNPALASGSTVRLLYLDHRRNALMLRSKALPPLPGR